ncbi:hypothetical protein INT80_01690 [Gallibacterium anatis]|uniref:Uncharacterized protein n=1 Tax=Gallibacterium anatis TaxID=750 RepID=A0A930UW71_9PAST|nr:hypothetical protein [Gallibacterium anatis]
MLAELPAAIFTATDSLGWVYQFWQAKKKTKSTLQKSKLVPENYQPSPSYSPSLTWSAFYSTMLRCIGNEKLSETDLKTAQSEAITPKSPLTASLKLPAFCTRRR